MSDNSLNDEPTAHMIDVEQEMFMGCSATELRFAGLFSVAAWVITLLALFALLGWYLILAPVIGFVLGMITAWRTATWIGKQKRGKPHLYYIHKLEMDFFSRIRRSPFVMHEGTWALGRIKPDKKS
ncbi:MAG: TIGR03750 family conjugal transfer protein [Gammaproteobacteria bacterium]|nr:TIGR03750 family conjugal transfer protein [Gammaproteobacteria bacterium]